MSSLHRLVQKGVFRSFTHKRSILVAMKFNLPGAVILSLVSWCFAQNNGTATNNYIGSTPSQRLIINQSQAQQMINTAVSYAANISIPFNVAILDPSGLLVAFLRMDNAFWGGIE